MGSHSTGFADAAVAVKALSRPLETIQEETNGICQLRLPSLVFATLTLNKLGVRSPSSPVGATRPLQEQCSPHY